MRGADQQEKLVYQINKDAGNKGESVKCEELISKKSKEITMNHRKSYVIIRLWSATYVLNICCCSHSLVKINLAMQKRIKCETHAVIL